MKGCGVRGRLVAGVAGAALCLSANLAVAQTDGGPSQSAMTNLIHLLVKQKVITQQSADALLKEAEQEAAQARSAKTNAAAVPVPIPAARPELPPPAPGVVRVPYVPQIVRNQIRDEVKAEVLKEAKAENWAQPNIFPDWVRRISWYGLMRVRDESDFYGANNIGSDGIDGYVNYEAFNANGPTNVNPNNILNTIPFLDTTQNRIDLLSLSARIGLTANVADGVQAGVQLASGGDNGPVSTTQIFGGGFTKKNIYLDLSYITLTPFEGTSLTLGRMLDPFFRTDLLFHDTLNMDGVEVTSLTKPLGSGGLGEFATLGAFPVNYINYSFPTFSPSKAPDHTEWLFGGQLGEDWANSKWDWRSAVSMYYYLNAQGELSSPCPIYLGTLQCSTDDMVPPYMQKGNTLFLLRNIIPDPSNPTNYAQPQFAGLLFKYEELDATTSFDLRVSADKHLIFTGDYVRNLAYDGGLADRYAAEGVYPVTNFNPSDKTLQSGPNAFMGRVLFGDPDPRERFEWNVIAGYKYLQPDASARRLHRLRFPSRRHQRQGIFREGDDGPVPQHVDSGALVQRQRSLRSPARHRRPASRSLHGILKMSRISARKSLFPPAGGWRNLAVLAVLAAIFASPAQAQTLEDRLRDQLRATLNQLHDLQDQQAALQAEKLAAEKDRDALKVQLAAARAQLAHAGQSVASAQAQAYQAEILKDKAAIAAAQGGAQQAQADRDKLQAARDDAQKLLGVCEDKNSKLLKTGNEILDAYQKFDFGDAIGANEPFIGIKRVELENTAQGFDDSLHEGKFDPHAKLPAKGPGAGQ